MGFQRGLGLRWCLLTKQGPLPMAQKEEKWVLLWNFHGKFWALVMSRAQKIPLKVSESTHFTSALKDGFGFRTGSIPMGRDLGLSKGSWQCPRSKGNGCFHGNFQALVMITLIMIIDQQDPGKGHFLESSILSPRHTKTVCQIKICHLKNP